MKLVDYSSDQDDEEKEPVVTVATPSALPNLPASFHDLYPGTFPL